MWWTEEPKREEPRTPDKQNKAHANSLPKRAQKSRASKRTDGVLKHISAARKVVPTAKKEL